MMLALSPPLFSNFVWPLDQDLMGHEHNGILFNTELTETNSDQSFLNSPASFSGLAHGFKRSSTNTEVDGDVKLAKKLNHNASERDRRKKINGLYASLHSLLPPTTDRTKKLSIPATVSRVLKYVPQLKREVENLVEKKEELNTRINSRKEIINPVIAFDHHHQEKKRKCGLIGSSLSAVWASPLGDKEVIIQICILKPNTNVRVSEILLNLEEELGLILLNISCFESFGERVFHNLHLQVQGNQVFDFEMLREKLLSMVS